MLNVAKALNPQGETGCHCWAAVTQCFPTQPSCYAHASLKVNRISLKFQVYVKVLPQTMPHLMAVLKSLVQNIAFASTVNTDKQQQHHLDTDKQN